MPSFRSTLEPVLGTRLTMRVDASDAAVARASEEAAVEEADRLEAILSTYRPDSPFSAWRRGELADPPPEIATVLGLAAEWFTRTTGAFHPCVGEVMRRWSQAEAEQCVPDPMELLDLVATALPYRVERDVVHLIGDGTTVDVHGIAKGWVVDRMVERALVVAGVDAVIVDLGGDLRHARRTGGSTATIAIENPFTVVDNAAPLRVVSLTDQAIATSAGGRRGWRIGDEWFGHLLDPATGWPLADRRSATVVAGTTADADAGASAVAVGGIELAESLGIAALVVHESGSVTTTSAWVADVVEVHRDR